MRRVNNLAERIRGYVNDAHLFDRQFKSNPDEWNALCVAMDTLDDSCLALECYEARGIGEEYGERYLKLYGLLQAVFLQQDSIRYLYRMFVGAELQTDSCRAWNRIRDLRNLTIGHPVEKRDKRGVKRCFVSRVQISSSDLQLIIWDSDTQESKFENVDLLSLYEEYKLETLEYLETIIQSQIQRWG